MDTLKDKIISMKYVLAGNGNANQSMNAFQLALAEFEEDDGEFCKERANVGNTV